MVTLDNVLDLAHFEGIKIKYWHLSKQLLGYTLWYPNLSPIILLDNSLNDNTVLHKVILAEEIGHVFTGIGNGVTRSGTPFRDKCMAQKCESMGLIWQVNYLVPYPELKEAVASGITEPWELAEHFQVTQRLMWRRLTMADAQKLRHMGA